MELRDAVFIDGLSFIERRCWGADCGMESLQQHRLSLELIETPIVNLWSGLTFAGRELRASLVVMNVSL